MSLSPFGPRRVAVLVVLLWCGFGPGCGTPESSLVVEDASEDVRGERPAPGHDTMDSASPDVGAPDVATAPDTDEGVRLVGLRVDPPLLEVETQLGVAVEVQPTVVGLFSDGTEGPFMDGVRWFGEVSDVALIDAGTGAITVSGRALGDVRFGARLAGNEAVADESTLRVRLRSERRREGVGEEVPAAFAAAPVAGEAGPEVVYPLNGTMYPAGVTAPLIQWRGGGAGPWRVELAQGTDFVFVWYTVEPALQPEGDAWEAMASLPGVPIDVRVDAIEEGTLRRGPSIELLLADANLSGDVYYWQIATGDIMRIAEGSGTPAPLFADNAQTGTCRGCHTMTRDGGRIGFMYNGGDNPRAGLAWVNAPEPPVIANHSPLQWDWLSFDPSGHRAAAVYYGSMFLADTTPDLPEGATNLGPFGDVNEGGRLGTHPAWSPDGSRIAWVERNVDGSDWSFPWGQLHMMSRDARTGALSGSRLLVPAGGTAETDTISFPTWTPDSRWLAVSIGPDTVGTPPATLWLVDPASGERTHLARANPAGEDVFPSFSPYIEGGYYWLLFYSKRPYGNVTTNKQIWVAAIDTSIVPGVDASYPAFWLPGQDPTQINITATWSPAACMNVGDPCKSEAECCSGLACTTPPGGGDAICTASDCTLAGQPCETTASCCPGDECLPDRDGVPVCQIGWGR